MHHDFTFAQLQMYIEGRMTEKSNAYKDGWERTRSIIHVIAAVNGAKESARELMPLPWDKKKRTKKTTFTKEEEAGFAAILDKLNGKTDGISRT